MFRRQALISAAGLKSIRFALLAGSVLAMAMVGPCTVLRTNLLELTLSVTVAATLSLACLIDARLLGRRLVCPARLGLLFAWPLAVPIYLIWARGWRGLVAALLLGGFLVGAAVAGVVVTVICTVRF